VLDPLLLEPTSEDNRGWIEEHIPQRMLPFFASDEDVHDVDVPTSSLLNTASLNRLAQAYESYHKYRSHFDQDTLDGSHTFDDGKVLYKRNGPAGLEEDLHDVDRRELGGNDIEIDGPKGNWKNNMMRIWGKRAHRMKPTWYESKYTGRQRRAEWAEIAGWRNHNTR